MPSFSRFSLIEVYRLFTQNEKSTYETMNMLQSSGNVFYGYFWSPCDKTSLNSEIMKKEGNYTVNMFNQNIDQLEVQIEEVPFTKLCPPTFFETNEFTWAFQEIVNTYGHPNFGEMNPAVFAIVSFPFLFGVMFGDIGHGGALLAFAVILCLFADQLKSSPSFAILV